MSDLNWNKLPWRKSSFSSDSANCVEVAWPVLGFCHQDSCVEVGWTASSRCAGGDCVQVRHESDVVYVRDSKLGEDSPVQEWPLTYWEFLCDAIVADLPRFSGFRKLDDGGVELRWAHIHPAPLIFDAGEWKAFVLGVRAGEFDPDRLTERFQSSSSRRGVAEEDREGSGGVAGPDQAADGSGLRPSLATGAGEAGAASSRPAPVAADRWPRCTECGDYLREFPAAAQDVPAGRYVDPIPRSADHPRTGQPGPLDDRIDLLLNFPELVEAVACAEYEYDNESTPGGWYVPWGEVLKLVREQYEWRAEAGIRAAYPLLRARWESEHPCSAGCAIVAENDAAADEFLRRAAAPLVPAVETQETGS
jgi:hypothetical protein